MDNLDQDELYLGRYARSIETGWIGKIVAVERERGEVLLEMKGVNMLVLTINGGDIDDCLDDDDTQWFTPEDLKFLKYLD